MNMLTFYPVAAVATVVVAAPMHGVADRDVETAEPTYFGDGEAHHNTTPGSITLTPTASSSPLDAFHPDQWYYWTTSWQREEARSMQEYAAGRFQEFDTVEDLFAWLDE